MMKLGSFPLFILISLVCLSACRQEIDWTWQSNWPGERERIWIGPEYWANRLQDWRLDEGRAQCIRLLPLRTLHLLTAAVEETPKNLYAEVELGFDLPEIDSAGPIRAGFMIGAGRGLDYRAAALIHHSYGEGAGLFAGVDTTGRLFIQDLESEAILAEALLPENTTLTHPLVLRLQTKAAKDKSRIRLRLLRTGEGKEIHELRFDNIDTERLIGHLALVADGHRPAPAGSVWFRNWKLGGKPLALLPDRSCGPVIAAQHVINRRQLNLTAQLMPVGEKAPRKVELQVLREGAWTTAATSQIVEPGFTAPFQVLNWPDSLEVPYRVAYDLKGSDEPYYYEGTIRPIPASRDTFILAAFTGNHNVVRPDPEFWGGVDLGRFPWNWGVWFPHTELVANVKKQDPDFLFFSGDQIYEGASPTWPDFQRPFQDYLYKWYLWCWAFGELTADIPAVTIPDDHDVYHGNIWGDGGTAAPEGLVREAAQDAGGYRMPPDWVNMVIRTQTSHLPTAYDPEPVGIGIENYYTDIQYGDMSFAVLEDRKFKTPPREVLPAADVVNGWAQNPDFDARKEGDVPDADLLGETQLEFLNEWAADWSNGTQMKVALSQTIFANLATLPAGSTSGAVVPSLPIPEPGEYPPNDRPVADMDSNGWPKSGRDRAVRALRKGFALHVAGDQHLGSTIQYGVEEWNDAGFALCVPSIANFWARRWFPADPGLDRDPEAPPYTGKFEDGFGNKMTVYAVANPQQRGREPAERHDKAAGYGIVRFFPDSRKISLENWPIWSDPAAGGQPYPGWPVLIDQCQNYRCDAPAHLAPIEVEGETSPVVQLVDEAADEIVYTLRLAGNTFEPWAPEAGRTYTLRIGDPDADSWQELQGLVATSEPSGQPLVVRLAD